MSLILDQDHVVWLNCKLLTNVFLCRDDDKRNFFFLSGGVIPDAAAIHAARKQRQAARDGGQVAGSYIPIKKKSSQQNSADDESADEDDDNVRIKFAGVKSGKREEFDNGRMDDDDDDEHGWEEQQIRKAMKNLGTNYISEAPTPSVASEVSQFSSEMSVFPSYDADRMSVGNTAITYNLEGIKGRLKLRYVSL